MAPEAKQIKEHLLADGQPPKFVDLADVQIHHGSDTLLCHSSCLARYSNLFCEMFTSTERAGWGEGLGALFKGHTQTNCMVILAMMHGSGAVSKVRSCLGLPVDCASWADLEDFLELAHKLDAPSILQVSNIL